MIESAFYFILKALFVLKIFKWLGNRTKVNFKMYDIINWEAINYKHILQNISRK